MRPSRLTNLKYNNQVIHTEYDGNVDRDFIIDAITEWEELISNNVSITCLVFDYTNANMDALDVRDAEIIAKESQRLVAQRPLLKLIGVMPRKEDFAITTIWTAHSIKKSSFIDFKNIAITKNLSEAVHIIENELGLA